MAVPVSALTGPVSDQPLFRAPPLTAADAGGCGIPSSRARLLGSLPSPTTAEGEGAELNGEADGLGMKGVTEGAGLKGEAEGAGLKGVAEGAVFKGVAEGAGLKGVAEGAGLKGDDEGAGLKGDDEGAGLKGVAEGAGLKGEATLLAAPPPLANVWTQGGTWRCCCSWRFHGS